MNISVIDALTGLPGRHLLDSIQVEFDRRGNGQEWTFIMIDIDHFKLINDIYGHLSGDRVLVEVARILQSNLRKSDIMLRFGGDEFLGIFRDTQTEHALNYTERVLDELRKTALFVNLKPTLSMGLGESKPEDHSISAAIERADKALYNAKESGRGRISFASDHPVAFKTGSIRLSHFVGRRTELTGLRQLMDESESEGARFALLEGEAGVGKSRLAGEMIHYARFRKSTVLQAACFEFGDSEPYGFLLFPLRRILGSLSPEKVETIRKIVEPFHPATAELFPEMPIKTSGDLQFFREERLKFRIFDDFNRLFRALSSISAILIIVDDVQWMTTPDLELFKYIVRSAQHSSITFVATMRSLEKSSDTIRRHLVSLSRSIPLLHLRLNNLEKQETFNLIMFALKDPNIPQNTLETIYRQSGGNPFFLEELINSLIQNGSIKRSSSGDWSYFLTNELQLPESLAQLIGARLYPLSSESRNYLRMAALAAGNFSAEMICAASGDELATVVQCLEEPVRLGLILCETIGNKTMYRFAHDTICSFLHRETSGAMKKLYHTRIAEFLEIRIQQGAGDDLVVAMAYHFSESDNREKACQSALRAANVFANRQANRDTARWLETYFSFRDDSPESQKERFDAHVRLGSLYMVLGEFDKARNQLQLALTLISDKDEESLVRLKQGHIFQDISRYSEARESYQTALKVAENPLKKVDALNSIAFLDYLSGDLLGALANNTEAENLFNSIDTDSGLGEKYQASLATTKGVIKCAIMPGDEAAAEYEKALALYVKHGDFLGQATIYNNLSDIFSRTGHYEKALDALKKAESIDTRLDDALNMAIVFYNTAILYSEINQPIQAREYFQRYADISRDINNELGIGYSNLGSGELYEEEGDLDRAEAAFRKSMDIFLKLRIDSLALAARLNLIHILIQKKRIHEARDCFRTGVDLDREIMEMDLMSEIFFIQGLLKLDPDGHTSPTELQEAEMLIHRSLETSHNLDVSFLMRRYYHLIEIQIMQGKEDIARETRTNASDILSERLGHIENALIRDNICRKKYIREILLENRK